MAKQLNVNLAFTADTGRAKAQLKDLQNQLTQVINLSTRDIGGEVMAQDIEKASLAAAQLKAHLEDATNVKTGKLDLGKLSEALDTKKLKSYRNSLQAIGVEGQKAFMMLAQSITDAEVPLRRTSNLMTELWATMKNTMRWQFTSSAMHGFMSAVSSAYGYAQDLNESLNNIRIVSGQNTEQMAKFAEQANKAAKALNTTTTSYTNAALIYYQQGLSDSEIKERTDITIKMANVARESAEVVSDQLTAVWNNFYKEGEKGLQHYADVMTALGAETASSTDEIAGGLEKFSSIADMIGLSFEYAASALATITATTRQSEEVVGTALKTIFARIQGLKLGETLEDGTDLNKYSDSLKRVGIEIFDTTGQLKNMDDILNEIGARWDQLAKNEQVALAQAVAGIRQYNQLVSLMDNWDYFQQNLQIANTSEGALDEQAKIYEESWEAASNHVRAAMESIYSDIIKDEAFINMLDNIEGIIRGIDKLIDSVGGLGGVLSALGAIGTKVFHEQLTASLKNMAYSIDMTFGLGKERAQNLQKAAWEETEKFEVNSGTFEGTLKGDLIREQSKLQQSFIENSSKMSQEEIKVNQVLLDRNKILTDIVGQRANEITKLEDVEKRERANLELEIRRKKKDYSADYIKSITSDFKNVSRWSGRMLTGLSFEETENPEKQNFNRDELYKFFEKNSQGGVLNNLSKEVIEDLFKDQAEDYIVSISEVSDAIFFKQLAKEEEFGYLSGLDDKQIQEMVKRNHTIAEGYIEISRDGEKVKESMEGLLASFIKAKGAQKQFSDVIVSSANAISNLQFSIITLKTAFDTLDDPNMSSLDKFLSISTSLLTAIPMLSMGIKGLLGLLNKETLTIVKNTAAQLINTLAIKANIVAVQEQGEEIAKNTKIWTNETKKLIPKLLKVAGPYAIALSAIALGILGIIKAQEEWYATTPEGKLEAAKEAAAEAETAFNDVATAINEVRNSIDGLESSYDKIANLTKGTLEWHQAVSDVNAEILNLIDKYPELSNSLQIDENGILSIPENKLEELEKQLTRDLTSARNISLVAQQEVDRAQQVVDRQGYKTFGAIYTSKTEESYAKQEILNQNGKVLAEVDNNLTDEILQLAEQIYAKPGIGAQLFTDEYLEAWAKELGVNSEALKELIYANEKLIIEMSAMTDSIEAQDEVLLRNRLNDYGSNMSYEEALALTGKESYADYVDTFKEQVKLTENDYQDYVESIGAEFEEIKNGRLYYKKEGQEEPESIDISVLEGIKAEGLANEALYQKVAKKAYQNVSTLGLKGDENLSDESYIRLDNLQRSIDNLFESSIGINANAEFDRIMSRLEGVSDAEKSSILAEEKAKLQKRFGTQQGIDDNGDYIQEDTINFSGFEGAGIGHFDYNSIYKNLLEGYTKEAEQKAGEYQKAFQSALELDNENIDEEKLNEKLGSWENIERSAENLRIINAAVKEFNTDLKAGVDSSDEFIHTMDKLATQAQLDDMTTSFKEAGKVFGLNDEESKEIQDYAKYLSEISEESEDLSDNLATDAEASADVAIQVTRMNKGVKTLAEGFSDWNDVLRKSSKESKEYSDALNKTRSALSDVLNVEEDFIKKDFVEEHLDDIKLAAEGNGEAIDRLKMALADDIILNITGKEKFEELETGLQSAITNMKSILDNTDFKIGQKLGLEDQTALLESCQKIVDTAEMTAEEAQAYFNSIGYEPEFEMTNVTKKVPAFGTVTYTDEPEIGYVPDGKGGEYPYIKKMTTRQEQISLGELEQNFVVPAMSEDGKGPKIKSLTKLAPGSSNDYSPKNSGGGNAGGGSKTKVKQTKRSDVVDRYKEITDQLNDVQDAASDASKSMDRLYGANRLSAMSKQNDLIQKEIGLLKAKRSEAEAYLALDRQNLMAEAQKAGVQLEIGADGNISNYTTIMNGLFDQLAAAEKASGETADEYEQENIDNINTKIEDLKKAISQYDDTRELLQDLENQIEDKFHEWQDNNYEKLTYSLELKVEINDMQLEHLDYYLNKYADNFYRMAESAALLSGKIYPIENKLKDQAQIDYKGDLVGGFDKELADMYEKGEISQANYIEGLKNSRKAIYENLNALIDLDKQMTHYYEDTLSAATAELADHTDHMEHLTSVFDHYINLMNILGKSKNYDAIGDFLGGKADTIRDRLNVAKEYYEMLLVQKEDVEAKLNTALARGDDAAAELYKEEWDAIVDEVDAAQEQVLNLTEEWAESMKAVIENNMAQIAETLEKTLTNGISFDELMNGFDKLNTRQEEYLTKTNQIYETNKLMRTASQALDETDNIVAKQKLKNFIEETKGLQQNTRLSEYELEIQQAKYDLLLAEIALEEAQNAKSTVRMAQDNEGNFGYVFTADPEEIDNAQQGVEDAENRLYNISLEGQQEYTEKYLQAQQEMYNELTDLQQMYLDGQIASEEEYERRKEEILNHYLNPEDGILTTYSHLFNVAVQTDADATADYWAKDYAAMTQNTEEWKVAVNDYLVEVEEETAKWASVSTQANRDVEYALSNSSEATRELTAESEELADLIQNDVIDAIEDEIEMVAAQTAEYAAQRQELLDLIDAYEKYLELQREQIEDASRFDENKDYAFSMIQNAASGNVAEANADITARVYKVASKGGKYSAEQGQALINAIDNLSDSNKKTLLAELEQAQKTGYNSDIINGILKKFGISAYASGGYTGTWGPEGKLAFLHEKEIVLNAEDTQNILTTVSFVRDLVSMIDSQAKTASLINLSAYSGIPSTGQTLEQQVSIRAEFPNATDRYEIEEAFNSLVNKASQYANRK